MIEIRILDNETLKVIFESANVMRLDIDNEKKATRFEVESGAVRSDHVIDSLVEVMIDLVLVGDGAVGDFAALEDYYNNRKLVTVQSRMKVYPNLLVEAMPHTESGDIFDGSIIGMRLVEWKEVVPEYGALRQEQVVNPDHSSTQQRGRQSGIETNEAEGQKGRSILHRWTS